MKPQITELELLIDKINLLYQNIKSDGKIERIEGELLLKYIHQLRVKVEQIAEIESKPEVNLRQNDAIKTEVIKEVPPVVEEVKNTLPDKNEKHSGVNVNAFEQVEIKKEISKETEFPRTEKKVKKSFISENNEEEDLSGGLNKKLSKENKTLADKILKTKSKDLASSIDLNERIYFTRHLFKGDSLAFDKAIREINSLNNEDEAGKFIENELIHKLNWNENDAISRFRELAFRKFR